MKEAVIGAKRIEKECAQCGKRFVTNHSGVKYCSEKCYKEKLKKYKQGRKEARKKYCDLPQVRARIRESWRKSKHEKYSTPEGRRQMLDYQKKYRSKRA